MKAILTIHSQARRPLSKKELTIIEQALNQRFVDARFQLEPAPSYFTTWDSSKLPAQLKEIYDILLKAEDWTRLDQYGQARVYIHRLNHKLPDYLKVIVKRNYGYKLIDLREQE